MGGPLRVLHVVVNMNRGGAETLIMNLYRNMDRSKVQFDFLTCKEGVFDKEIKEMGGKVHRIPYITEAGHFGYLQALDSFFASNKYKIVHSHIDKMSGLVLRAAKKAGIPKRIAHSHNTQSEGHFITKMYKWHAGRFIKPNATNFYACSNAAANWMFQSHSKQTFILNNGIDISKFQFSNTIRNSLREKFNIDDQTLVLGHVGRFNEQKNHPFLIDLFANMEKEISNVLLLLVGDGVLRERMEERVQYLGLEEKVKFLGIRDDIHEVLQMLDLFIFPSIHEGLPVTLIEAQASGLPCIISDSITEEVDMDLGLVYRHSLKEMDNWIRRIIELKNNYPIRKVNKERFSLKGYDIKLTALTTQNKYLTLGVNVI